MRKRTPKGMVYLERLRNAVALQWGRQKGFCPESYTMGNDEGVWTVETLKASYGGTRKPEGVSRSECVDRGS